MVKQSKDIKNIVMNLGVDLCGIAPAERFNSAPDGFHPTDIYERCKSVVVFACKVPAENIFAKSCIPYTFVNTMMNYEVDRLTVETTLRFEEMGLGVVPIPSDDPYEYWEPEKSYGRAILSMRHAGYLAGLGRLGRSTLLINEEFGSMIQIGTVLVDVELEGDPLAVYEVCPPDCRECIENCPSNALDGETVIQALCRPLSVFTHEKGYVLKKCNLCRKVCPNYHSLS